MKYLSVLCKKIQLLLNMEVKTDISSICYIMKLLPIFVYAI